MVVYSSEFLGGGEDSELAKEFVEFKLVKYTILVCIETLNCMVRGAGCSTLLMEVDGLPGRRL